MFIVKLSPVVFANKGGWADDAEFERREMEEDVGACQCCTLFPPILKRKYNFAVNTLVLFKLHQKTPNEKRMLCLPASSTLASITTKESIKN